jgi:DNA-binding PucR family transcriptional regulator
MLKLRQHVGNAFKEVIGISCIRQRPNARTFSSDDGKRNYVVQRGKQLIFANAPPSQSLRKMGKVHTVHTPALLAEHFQPSITCPMQDRANSEWTRTALALAQLRLAQLIKSNLDNITRLAQVRQAKNCIQRAPRIKSRRSRLFTGFLPCARARARGVASREPN